ncbi:MAG: universal stress protein [Candidatus Methanomethyliaceae archaeon]|nr:universal stress protein [Candidatus Methanomethyliaceae archaeon]
MIQAILVLLDSSPISEQALLEATNIAKIYNSKITCIHPVPRHDNILINEGQRLIKRAEEIVKSAGLEFDSRIVEDDPGSAIVKAAVRLNADLIVMGSLGEEGIKRRLVVSAAEYVVRNAPCDVLIVKRRKTIF